MADSTTREVTFLKHVHRVVSEENVPGEIVPKQNA